jgi:phosphatidylglycerol:prolipoprotein diacylglycerol transferase
VFPILFQFGPVTIYTHDFSTTLGLVAGLLVYYYELRRRNMLSYPIFWISIAAITGGALGARLIEIFDHPSYYANVDAVPFTYFLTHSGKGIIGGIAGGYLSVALSKRALHYTISTGDCYAPAIPVAMAIGRIGCFLTELPLGTPTNLPWGIAVSPEVARLFPNCSYCTQPMHPSMLYEIIFNLVALALILRYRHLVFVRGDTLKLYLLASAVFRFLVEYVRGSPEYMFGLTAGQVAILILAPPLVVYFVRQWRRGMYNMPRPPLAPGVSPAVERAPFMPDELAAS